MSEEHKPHDGSTCEGYCLKCEYGATDQPQEHGVGGVDAGLRERLPKQRREDMALIDTIERLQQQVAELTSERGGVEVAHELQARDAAHWRSEFDRVSTHLQHMAIDRVRLRARCAQLERALERIRDEEFPVEWMPLVLRRIAERALDQPATEQPQEETV